MHSSQDVDKAFQYRKMDYQAQLQLSTQSKWSPRFTWLSYPNPKSAFRLSLNNSEVLQKDPTQIQQ